jgi:hypothetical protein
LEDTDMTHVIDLVVKRALREDSYVDLRERFRLAMLSAADDAMNEIVSTGGATYLQFRDNCVGARDADLPELFKALDAQFDRNLKHGGIQAICDQDENLIREL